MVILGTPKLKIIGFGGHGHVHQVRKSWKARVFRFSQNEIEKLVHKEAEKIYGVFGRFLNNIYDRNAPPDPKSGFSPDFLDFL